MIMHTDSSYPRSNVIHTYHKPTTWFVVAADEGACIYTRHHTRVLIPTDHVYYEDKYEQELVPVLGMVWEEDYMADLALRLQASEEEREFDRLALIATPDILEELKERLNQNVMARVVAQLPDEPVEEYEVIFEFDGMV